MLGSFLCFFRWITGRLEAHRPPPTMNRTENHPPPPESLGRVPPGVVQYNLLSGAQTRVCKTVQVRTDLSGQAEGLYLPGTSEPISSQQLWRFILPERRSSLCVEEACCHSMPQSLHRVALYLWGLPGFTGRSTPENSL